MRRFLLLALLVVASGALLQLRTFSSDVPDPGPSVYKAMLTACSQDTGRADQGASLGVRICIWETLDLAYRNGDTAAFALVLGESVDADPRLRMACHPAAHMLTEERAFDKQALLALLGEVSSTSACDWALGHAAVSGLGLLGEDEFHRGEILGWCTALAENLHIYSNCVDAVGHHVWLATGSLEESVVACAEVPPAYRNTCGGGVLMQMFEPATQTTADYRRADAATVIPGICSEWRRLAPDLATAEACAHGAGYVYGLDLRDAVFRGIRSSSTSESGVTQDTYERMLFAERQGVERCGDLGSAIAAACENMLARSIPIELTRADPTSYASLCAVFSYDHVRGNCLSRAA